MLDELSQLISRLSNDSSLFSGPEDVVRQGVILPILAKLGWDPFNIHEVVPEHKVEGGHVDYCLQIGKKKHVFIEVKRLSGDLEKYEKQLLEYSIADMVSIASLTDGLIWRFYLPFADGTWHERKFFTIDIQQQDPDFAANHFYELLNRGDIQDGSAIKRARDIFRSKENRELITRILPEAWDQLIKEADEGLLEILSNRVESICGYQPDPDQLKMFVMNKVVAQSPPAKKLILKKRGSSENKDRKTIRKKPVTGSNSDIDRYFDNRPSKSYGIVVTIDSNTFYAITLRELYENVLKYLYRNGYLAAIDGELPLKTNSKRYLISKEPFHPEGNPFDLPVEYKGYYLESNKDDRNGIKSLLKLLNLCGLSLTIVE